MTVAAREFVDPVVDPLEDAAVLVETGALPAAEQELAEILDARPDDLQALSLFARIKHIRGELSEAVACWARMHAATPVTATAEMHLASMLHLAQDPEAGVGEFLAFGRNQLVRKPAAYLALEHAFQLVVARRPTEACAHCRQIALKYRDRDREVYKLARLAEAWLHELAGELDQACALLERFGTERGFEADLDRVLALARVYECVGTPEKLQAAANIFLYLERIHKHPEVLGRLARIYLRLDLAGPAEEYEKRHEEAFRHAFHRPTFAQIVRVAARRFLPVESLRGTKIPAEELPPEASRRERAIAALLRGEHAAARIDLSKSDDLLDRKYLGNLLALDGDREAGVRLLETALAEDPNDLHVIGVMLDAHVQAPSAATATVLADSSLSPRLRERLSDALRADPGDARAWRWLSILHRLARDGGLESERCAARAAALEHQPVGRALAAAVYHFIGKAKGLIHEVWADREAVEPGRGGALPSDRILGNITPEMKDLVRNICFSVQKYAQSKFPHLTRDLLDYNYTFKVTKEDERSGGDSVGLPTALAFLSVFLQRPLPRDVASSGVIVVDAHDVLSVRAVGEADYKVAGAYGRNLRQIILPQGNRPGLEQGSLVPHAICRQIVTYASDLDDAVKLAFGEEIFL